MKTSSRRIFRSPRLGFGFAILTGLLLGLLALGCSSNHNSQASLSSDGHDVQQTAAPDAQMFASPEAAAQVLADAARTDNTPQLLAIFGSEGKEIISTGDEVADRQGRQKFAKLYEEKHTIEDAAANQKTLVISDSDWPFPVPIVRDGKHWYFDSAAGKEEILDRRIGRNELSAIQVCQAIADAQKEYAIRNPSGGGLHEYAQKFASDPGERNGLFWPTDPGEEPSPLGELAAAASAEGYVRRETGPTPYHGYYYRILTAQGSNAPGGAMDYLVEGKMALGFAVVAYPAEYGNSGIMTFIMGDEGVVYQKDLGPDTPKLVPAMNLFDPGPGWQKVE